MATKKGAESSHSFFKDSYELHKSVGSFDGGACLNGHASTYKERDSCSYRWQGLKRAKESPGPYNSHPSPRCRLNGSGYGWMAPSSIAKGYAGKVIRLQGAAAKKGAKGVLKQFFEAKAFTNGFSPYSNQVHHVLPNSVLRTGMEDATKSNVDLLQNICDGLLEEKYNINFKVNMLILPVNWRDAWKVGLPTHCGDHPSYSASVKIKVMKAFAPYAALPDDEEEHDEPDFEELKDELQEVSKAMYDSIVDYGQSNILRGTGPVQSVNSLPKSVFSVLSV